MAGDEVAVEIEHAFLCRYAESNPDGTFDTIGTGFTIVRARSFPTVIPVMVILKLNFPSPARELNLGNRSPHPVALALSC